MTDTNLLQSRPHFQILDGMRGIAAIAIVVFHFMEWIYAPEKNFIGHGFLAVDFFFCLSGFVIGYAYDKRLPQIGLKQFFLSRLIRLQPMVVLGSVLGLLTFLSDPFATFQFSYPVTKILLLFICSLLLIPLPIMEERSFNLFGLNAPAWSLFWEYIANIIYAFVLVRLPRRFLFFILIFFGAGLFYVAATKGNLLGGWAGENFWDGGIRIGYSFTAGLLIHRYQLIIKNKLGFFIPGAFLVLAFIFPHLPNNGIMEACIVTMYFPLLVSIGAGSTLHPKMIPSCKLLGDISYPLYMSHYAFIWIFGNYFLQYKPAIATLVWIIIGGSLLLIFFSWLIMKFYDMPVRKFFTRLRMKRN